MKTTPHLYLLLCLFLCSSVAFGQNVSKTLVKSFNPANADLAEIVLDGNVEIKSWSNSIVRVQMSVSLLNANEYMLKGLVQAGRYNLKGKQAEGVLHISAPGLNRDVEINGRALEEKITYVVYLPERMAAKQAGEATADPTSDTDSM